jgi:hypothetical protein
MVRKFAFYSNLADEIDPKLDKKNADEVMIGLYSREAIEHFIKQNKKQ